MVKFWKGQKQPLEKEMRGVADTVGGAERGLSVC